MFIVGGAVIDVQQMVKDRTDSRVCHTDAAVSKTLEFIHVSLIRSHDLEMLQNDGNL